MSVVQRKAMLKADGFFPHKKNAKGTTIIYSRKHPTARFVRVVVDSGIDSKTNKIVGKVGVKLCFINRQKGWREITGQVFTTNTGLAHTIKSVQAAETTIPTCKFCKAKKFKAKTGNVVCSNACWTAWAGKKKSEKTTKKSSQKVAAKSSQKSSAKKASLRAVKKKLQRKGQKNLQRFTQEILPGDLVTVEEFLGDKVTTDYTGSVLGIVQKVKPRKRAKRGQPSLQGAAVTTVWTANTALVPVWLLPQTNEYEANALKGYRFKVLSRKVEWVEVV